MTDYAMFLSQGEGASPLGNWRDGRFQLFPGPNKGKVVCPPSLAPASCGVYQSRTDEEWRQLHDTKSFGLIGAPATLHGIRVGTFNGFGVTPDDPEQAGKMREVCGVKFPGSGCVFMLENTLVTRAPVMVSEGWRPVLLTKAELADLEKRSWDYLLASRPEEKLKRELPVELQFQAFEVAGRRIEFASVGFETDQEGSAYGMSIAWGLVNAGQPFEFHGPQPIGFVHFYRLMQAVDIGADGSTEIILDYTTNSSGTSEIWQQKKNGTVELIGVVQQ